MASWSRSWCSSRGTDAIHHGWQLSTCFRPMAPCTATSPSTKMGWPHRGMTLVSSYRRSGHDESNDRRRGRVLLWSTRCPCRSRSRQRVRPVELRRQLRGEGGQYRSRWLVFESLRASMLWPEPPGPPLPHRKPHLRSRHKPGDPPGYPSPWLPTLKRVASPSWASPGVEP
jgi:hypothetical protein